MKRRPKSSSAPSKRSSGGSRSSSASPSKNFGEGARSSGGQRTGKRKPTSRSGGGAKPYKKSSSKSYEGAKSSSAKGAGGRRKKAAPKASDDGLVRLNKFIANSGICSRREADEFIKAGVVSVNGEVVTEMGYKVKPGDEVRYEGQRIRSERKVYLLLNKPKNYITTVDDPQQRKTVMELIGNACKERIYPVGRLDRATTGVLLFTNDGELTKTLTHPKYGVKKIYHVVLDKNVKKGDLETMAEGFVLDDGFIKADEVSYVGNGSKKSEVGIELHSGRNRIVRRMFEHFGYKVVKLDRVSFAGLTKKDVPRGRWRMLSEKEVGLLKMNSGTRSKPKKRY